MTSIIFQTTLGTIKMALDTDKVPETAENFLSYVKEGFYDNTIFHRVINGFVIQGGGFDKAMQQKANKDPIANQADQAGTNVRGSVAMARTNDPDSATSQFFINLRDNDCLDFRRKDSQGWGYCVFAHVVEGMDVVDNIARVATGQRNGHADVPLEPVVVIKAVVQESTAE